MRLADAIGNVLCLTHSSAVRVELLLALAAHHLCIDITLHESLVDVWSDIGHAVGRRELVKLHVELLML